MEKSFGFRYDESYKLALQMMTEQYQYALIFTYWEKIEQDAKNSIIYFAGEKKIDDVSDTQGLEYGISICLYPGSFFFFQKAPLFWYVCLWIIKTQQDVDLKPSIVKVPT